MSFVMLGKGNKLFDRGAAAAGFRAQVAFTNSLIALRLCSSPHMLEVVETLSLDEILSRKELQK